MDIEELKSLSYSFSGCIKFQQSTFVFPLLLQHMCVHELFVTGSLLGNFGEYKGWSLWHFSISNVRVDSTDFYWMGFFFPTWVLSDLVRKGKHLCVSSAAAAAAATALCVLHERFARAWSHLTAHGFVLMIGWESGLFIFLALNARQALVISFSPISHSKIQIQIQSLVLEASGE